MQDRNYEEAQDQENAYVASLNLKETLQKICEFEPQTEFLDLQNQAIQSVEQNLEPFISQLKNLKELNLEDNEINTLPKDLSQTFPSLQNLNLNGNNLDETQFQEIILSLNTIPNLTSLYINLHEEDQVDMVMRTMDRLEFLNGLPVERDILDDDEEEEDEQDEIEIQQEDNMISLNRQTESPRPPNSQRTKEQEPTARSQFQASVADSNLLSSVTTSDMVIMTEPRREQELYHGNTSNRNLLIEGGITSPVAEIPEQEDLEDQTFQSQSQQYQSNAESQRSMIEHEDENQEEEEEQKEDIVQINLEQMISVAQHEPVQESKQMPPDIFYKDTFAASQMSVKQDSAKKSPQAQMSDRVEFSMFETPSSQLVEDNRLIILQSGISERSLEELYKISETYDKIRQVYRNLKQDKDRELADFFEKHFKNNLQNKSQDPNMKELECQKAMITALGQKLQECIGIVGKENGQKLVSILAEMDSFRENMMDKMVSIQFQSFQMELQNLRQEHEVLLEKNLAEVDAHNREKEKSISLEDKVKQQQNEINGLRAQLQEANNRPAPPVQNHMIRQNNNITTRSKSAMNSNRANGTQSQRQPYNRPPTANQARNQRLAANRSPMNGARSPIPKKPTTVASGTLGPIQHRNLTLKQLRDTIQDMYSQKIKFDKKCEDSKQPRETMEQFMYTYLNQKYGLKNLIIEWIQAIINGIMKHYKDDHDVALFGKILKNECDEEFRFIQMHVKDTLHNLLKVLLKDRYPFKVESEINKLLEGIQNGVIEEWMWRKIIEKMYDPQDSQMLENRFQQQIQLRDENSINDPSSMNGFKPISDQQIATFMTQNKMNLQNKRMSRDEITQIMKMKNMGKLIFGDFQKIILDFQLQEHEKFLSKFTDLFKEVDSGKHSILNEQQFKLLIQKMNLIGNEDEIDYLLGKIDPFNNNKMTYSEIVQLLSSHLVPSDDDGDYNQSIPILEKFCHQGTEQDPSQAAPSHHQSQDGPGVDPNFQAQYNFENQYNGFDMDMAE